jgi:hypothetical protein
MIDQLTLLVSTLPLLVHKKEFLYENFNQNLLHITRIGSMGLCDHSYITSLFMNRFFFSYQNVNMLRNLLGLLDFFKNSRIENDGYSLFMFILKGNNTLK